jgi:hypothetical protein
LTSDAPGSPIAVTRHFAADVSARHDPLEVL